MFKEDLSAVDFESHQTKTELFDEIVELAKLNDYTVIELDDRRPWGGYLRFSNKDAGKFIADFFGKISKNDLEIDEGELSPKILVVAPKQRLSWQYHNRRAEVWSFLTDGFYKVSKTDNEGCKRRANKGDYVRFEVGDRHRLIGLDDRYILVAEIWQHADRNCLSDEDDTIRIDDDYNRK